MCVGERAIEIFQRDMGFFRQNFADDRNRDFPPVTAFDPKRNPMCVRRVHRAGAGVSGDNGLLEIDKGGH